MTSERKPHHMSAELAGLLRGVTECALEGVVKWRETHPDVADWRVETAHSSLIRARQALSYLYRNVDPEGDAARAELMRKRPELFTDEES
jgi:hypothetical protein